MAFSRASKFALTTKLKLIFKLFSQLCDSEVLLILSSSLTSPARQIFRISFIDTVFVAQSMFSTPLHGTWQQNNRIDLKCDPSVYFRYR